MGCIISFLLHCRPVSALLVASRVFVIGPSDHFFFPRCPYSSYSYNVLNRLPSCMCDHKFVITAFLQYYCLPGYNQSHYCVPVSGRVTTPRTVLLEAVLGLFVLEKTRRQRRTLIASTQGSWSDGRKETACRKSHYRQPVTYNSQDHLISTHGYNASVRRDIRSDRGEQITVVPINEC